MNYVRGQHILSVYLFCICKLMLKKQSKCDVRTNYHATNKGDKLMDETGWKI